MKRLLLIVISLLMFNSIAEAKHRHHKIWSPGYRHHIICHGLGGCSMPFANRRHHRGTRYVLTHQQSRQAIYDSGEVVIHPAGCPRVAFCGCGAALRLLGSPVRSLWLAANWFRFPRAAPGAGMAAVRLHHVMAILEYHGDGTATVYDANSGHHLTRIHRRSLAGYTIVNPRG